MTVFKISCQWTESEGLRRPTISTLHWGELAYIWVMGMWWQWGHSHSLVRPESVLFISPSIKWVLLVTRVPVNYQGKFFTNYGHHRGGHCHHLCKARQRTFDINRYSRSFKSCKDFARLSLPKKSYSNHCKEVKLWVGLHTYFSSYKVWEIK